MTRFYVYKCVADTGGAPCVDRGLLSLCICKPDIRSTAREGDFIFAFGSNSETPANRLVYVAEVTEKLTQGEYYLLEEYQDRSDCIYERALNGRFMIREDARHHGSKEAMIKDIGRPPRYRRANSLVSTNFRYFGDKGTDDWKAQAPLLARLVESLGQGHRVNLGPAVRAELLMLQKRMWTKYNRKVLGKPLHAPEPEQCRHDEVQSGRVGRRRRCRTKPSC
jgi:hypothetical protein